MKPLRNGLTSVELLVGLLIPASCFLLGCGNKTPYPDRVPVSPVGISSPCDACGFTLAVAEENLIVIQGNQYTICNETCAEKLRQDVATGFHE